ncbi:MAG: dihydrofolate reductase family protein [Acidobacteriota bacterium]|nr:dihydrofolate reductase family protein [Acidobacteriota bacterium]MDH3528922.1 dihydrofolate reductase family protein [Acidobacteriota bacterium]
MKRKLIYFLAASLDGYIARIDGSVDWLKTDDLEEAGDELKEFAASVDTVLFGRKTWEKGLELDPSGAGFAGYENYVFSRTARESDIPNVIFVNSDPAGFVRQLKEEEGKNIWLMGGGELAAALLDDGLIDEIVVSIQPVILGKGIPMFDNPDEFVAFESADVKKRKSGSIEVTYRLNR